ncbi:hypothetical protein NST74_24360 [Paenibacillus sp. FSL F4-0125]|uniref:hypothetical protein n=1 Tax=Paenibacillus sp. FSL F4-0125 TaxID=2954730 RepID=UPI0030F901D3
MAYDGGGINNNEIIDVDNRLYELENSIDEVIIDVSDSDYLRTPVRLAFYKLEEYSRLILGVNKERNAYKTYQEKEQVVEKYKKIYLSERKMYKRLLRNLNIGTGKLIYPDTLKGQEEYLYGALINFKGFNRDKSLDENLTIYMKAKLKQNIREVNQELFKLLHHPADYINTFSKFIGPNSVSKFRKDIIIYKDVTIAETESHSYSVFYNENTTEDTKNTLLSILAYFNGSPFFYFTENYNFNRKLNELYEQFDLLDMLRLRKKGFFDSNQKEPFYLELPILKNKNGFNMVGFQDVQHEMVFELYHASLKQFESLPRCVFLFRVFEYGVTNHYNPLMRPSNGSAEDALNYYVNKIMTHKFNPLYYVDFGTYENEEGTRIIRKRKAKYINFMTKLKEEAKKITKEWSNHVHLSNKSIGYAIYNTGRNAAAHGGQNRNARYDYSKNYKHINDVNIFLELIARYIIEILNPNLVNMVEKRKRYYVHYNNYEEIFKQERD